MPKVTIDGEELEVEAGVSVLQACEQAGVEIPRFCYHERLSVAGNCRMCLVEVSPGPPKPQASCALPVSDGMEIKTDSDMVRKARKGVMEFLLINHPLDCPICDQGGECDLQDQAVAYGHEGSRYDENKRAVKEKYMGPLVKTIMTRCIHCTRCVRFSSEVAGVDSIGLLNRGEHAEISTLEEAIHSELSGNVIDLCPVGALTSKPYAFTARPWELTKTESIDVMDAQGSNIRVDARGNEVLRILPRLHEEINEEWISDKTRFACDGLSRQRLDRPYVRGEHGKLVPVDWGTAFSTVAEKIKPLKGQGMAALAGDLACIESMYALKELMHSLGCPNLDCRQDGAKLSAKHRAGYIFNSGIAGIDETDSLLLIGTNPRVEASVLNARIRRNWFTRGLPIALIGEPSDLTYEYEHLGNNVDSLRAIAEGSHSFSGILSASEKPMVIIGMGALTRADGEAILAMAKKVADVHGIVTDDWNGFNVLHTAAARVGGLDIEFVPANGGGGVDEIQTRAQSGEIGLVYLLGADEVNMDGFGDAFIVYQGHHGDAGAHRADVILPGAAYTEKPATYVNTEGRVQMAARATFPPGEAREDWAVIRALSGALNHPLPFDTLDELRGKLRSSYPSMLALNTLTAAKWYGFKPNEGKVDPAPLTNIVSNFYMTNSITRASETMAQCTEELGVNSLKATGTNG
ncbi:MAG: NADH-quinone oxidoreductase subunit NuoG [Pseudomonadota bacterium]|nr:NADH-quinone oxidoreductase subunit NuoG [Pseudomonadota bacterium]